MLPLILFSLRILATVVWFRAAIVLSESPLRTVADRSVDLRLRLWRAAVERDCEAGQLRSQKRFCHCLSQAVVLSNNIIKPSRHDRH